MKKYITLLLFVTLSYATFSQLKGDIVRDNRKLVTPKDYIIQGIADGRVTFQIAVDINGDISSAKVVDSLTTLKSSPAKIDAYTYVKDFKFEPGTWFPKFHQGQITITMLRPK
ncbi:MAG: hypothetical protein H3C31_02235 [Brumimicrobium sp.]|nr:hypothetical protein [Brumimicrobium sp.]MCO5269725.1 hypothetical protein [Brumimicrobium sp.]